jgi:hypothetical protein
VPGDDKLFKNIQSSFKKQWLHVLAVFRPYIEKEDGAVKPKRKEKSSFHILYM